MKCGWLFLGMLDIGFLAGILILDIQGKFMHKSLVLAFILAYAAPITAFFGIILQDQGTTRYIYSLCLHVRFYFFVFFLPLTIIHTDNSFLVKMVCEMIL